MYWWTFKTRPGIKSDLILFLKLDQVCKGWVQFRWIMWQEPFTVLIFCIFNTRPCTEVTAFQTLRRNLHSFYHIRIW